MTLRIVARAMMTRQRQNSVLDNSSTFVEGEGISLRRHPFQCSLFPASDKILNAEDVCPSETKLRLCPSDLFGHVPTRNKVQSYPSDLSGHVPVRNQSAEISVRPLRHVRPRNQGADLAFRPFRACALQKSKYTVILKTLPGMCPS